MDCCRDLLNLLEVVSLLLSHNVLDVCVCVCVCVNGYIYIYIYIYTHSHIHIGYAWLLRRYATVGRTGTFPADGATDE